MIDVSIFMSGVRTNRWMNMYEGIKSSNNVSFEFVVVGPYEPNYTLPDNFKFIHSDVKPGQCFEIAARNSTGKALLQTADDMVYTPEAVDLMFHGYIKDPKKIMTTCCYWVDHRSALDWSHSLIDCGVDRGWPFLPVTGMYDRELHYELGGADRRFDAVMWELDMYMRLYESGVRTVLVNGKAEEINFPDDFSQQPSLFGRYAKKDRPKILKTWTKDGNNNIHRTSPVLSYIDKDILTVNQYAWGNYI